MWAEQRADLHFAFRHYVEGDIEAAFEIASVANRFDKGESDTPGQSGSFEGAKGPALPGVVAANFLKLFRRNLERRGNNL